MDLTRKLLSAIRIIVNSCGKGDFGLTHVTAPNPSNGGPTLMGEVGKIVPHSPMRFSKLQYTATGASVVVTFRCDDAKQLVSVGGGLVGAAQHKGPGEKMSHQQPPGCSVSLHWPVHGVTWNVSKDPLSPSAIEDDRVMEATAVHAIAEVVAGDPGSEAVQRREHIAGHGDANPTPLANAGRQREGV